MALTLDPSTEVMAIDIIKRACRLLRIYGPGDIIPEPEIADNLGVLNSMLDYFSGNGLLIVSRAAESFVLTASNPTYTIGSGGNFNTVRPVRIYERSSYIRDTSGNDSPLLPMTEEEYSAVSDKSPSGGSTPEFLWYNPKHPVGEINLYPAPQAGLTIVIVSDKPLGAFADVYTTFACPAGYRAFLEYNLAVWLADEYKKAITATVAAMAARTQMDIENRNVKTVKKDLQIPVGGGGGFNFQRGE